MKPVVLAIFFIGFLGFSTFGQEAKLMLPIGHSGSITSVIFSPDSKRILTTSSDATAKIWDTESGALLTDLRGHKDEIKAASFSLDGRWVVTVASDGIAKIWNARNGNWMVDLKAEKQRILTAAFSQDGSRVLTALNNFTAKVWDTQTGSFLFDLNTHSSWLDIAFIGFLNGTFCILTKEGVVKKWWIKDDSLLPPGIKNEERWSRIDLSPVSPDGKQKVKLLADNSVELVDKESGKVVAALKSHRKTITSVSFSKDGQKLLTASDDSTAKMWDVKSGHLLQTFHENTDGLISALFVNGGKEVLTISGNGLAKLFDEGNGTLLMDLGEEENGTNPNDDKDSHPTIYADDAAKSTPAVFSSNRTLVFIPSDFEPGKILNTQSRVVLSNLIGDAKHLLSAVFSPDNSKLLTVSQDGVVKTWDTKSGAILVSMTMNTQGLVYSKASFSPDGKKILTFFADTPQVWDAVSGTQLAELKNYTSWVGSTTFSPDSKRLVSASNDDTIRIYDAQNGRLLTNLNGKKGKVSSALFFSNGTKILTQSGENNVQIWDAQNNVLLTELKTPSKIIESIVISPDGQRVAAQTSENSNMHLYSRENKIQVWDVQSGVLLTNLTGHSNNLNSTTISPDGNRMVTFSSYSTEYPSLWDTKTGALIATLRGRKCNLLSVTFSLDSKKILLVADDLTAKIWNAENGELLTKLESEYREGASKSPIAAAISSDGEKVVMQGIDGAIKVWNGQTGTFLYQLKGTKGNLESVMFTKNDQNIITKTQDGFWTDYVEIWDAQSGTLRSEFSRDGKGFKSAVVSPNGEKILTVLSDDTAMVWNSQNGVLESTLIGHDSGFITATFSYSGKKMITMSSHNSVRLWDVEAARLIDSLNTEHGQNRLVAVSFSPDETKILTFADMREAYRQYRLGYSSNETLLKTTEDSLATIWNAEDGKFIGNLHGSYGAINSATFSPDGRYIAGISQDFNACSWDSQTGNLLTDRKTNVTGVTSTTFYQNSKYVLSACLNGTAKLWDVQGDKLIYTFFAIDSTDYLVTDPYGRYDGTEAARKLLYFTCGTEVIGLDQVKDQLWVPNLAERIMKGDSINAKKLSDLDICRLIPQVEKEEKTGYHFMITPQHGGLGETVVYVNGIEEKRYNPSQLTKTPTGYELNVDGQELQPYFIAGQQNPVTVKAYTANNDISSRGAEIMQDETKKKSVAPNLYAVMIGVSDYKGPELQLKYAAKDAEDISAAISASAKKLLDTTGGKEHVFMYNLSTGKNHYELPEKIAIKNLFGEIGKKATANDILLIFFAGHGVTSGEKKQFYFLTADASQSSATDAPAEVGISTKELSEWMQPSNIKAQKRILILDACNSGQAINELVKVGAEGQNYLAARNNDKAEQIKAIDKLNEKSGLFILAASASNQSAYEMGRYSQGLLTYSLLKAIKQQPDILEDNKYLNVSRWFNAAEKTVSDMVRETGNRQEPQIVSAGNFNIGLVDQEVMKGIKLADEKPLFTASNLQNNDSDIAADDLHLNSLLDNDLNEISARGDNNGITYIPGSISPDAYSVGGRYIVNGDALTVKVNIRQNDATKYKFELTGTKSGMKALAEKVVGQATDWIIKRR